MKMLLVCGGAVVLTLVQGAPASAEETGANVIEEVVVTARRREETMQSVPIPVSALAGEELRNRSSNDLSDLTRIVPNLAFQKSASNKGTAEVFLRGIGQVNWSPTQDPKVGVYLDGVYLGRPQGAVFDIMDLDRIEVLRGPQGTLFGRNTTAGLVHVITRKPKDVFEAEVVAGGGNDGQVTAGGVLNVPVGSTLAFRFSAQHRESDGYVKNRSTGADWNDENAQMFRASALWTPSDTFSAQVSADYQRARERAGLGSCQWLGPEDGAATLATGGLPFIAYVFGVYDEIADACNDTEPYRSDDNDPSDESNLDAWGVNLTLEWDVGFATLTSITAHRDMEFFNGSWGWASDKAGTASYLEVLGVTDDENDQWSQELRLAGSSGALDWVAGAYVFEEHAINPLQVTVFRGVAPPDCAEWPLFCFPVNPANPAAGTLGDIALGAQLFGSRLQEVDARNSSAAVFGELTWRFAERWSATAGARYTEDERKFKRSQRLAIGINDPTLVCPDGAAPTGGTTCRQKVEFDKVTPRVILSYDVNDDVMLYGGWSKGYSSGGFNQDVRMRPYDPETSDNWEVGLKSMWLERTLRLNVTAFHNTYKNQQLTVGRLVDGQITADLINAQEATLWGLEGELRWLPAEGWLLTASAGWIDGEYEKFTVLDNVIGPPPDFVEAQVERDLSDTDVIRGAPYTFSVSGSYTHALQRGGEITGQLGWSQRGRTYNTLETVDSSKQKAYGLLDGRLSWLLPNRRTTVTLWGRNLLDKEYFYTATDLSAGPTPSFTNTRYWGEPRRFGVELRHSM